MKFISLQENIEKAISTITKIANIKTQLPITANILLTTTSTSITCIGTDLENTVSVTLSGKIEAEGSIAIPLKTFFEVIVSLPKEQVTVEKEGLTIKVSCGNYSVKINGTDASEFPALPPLEGNESIHAHEIFTPIKYIAFAASTDEGKGALTGILFHFEKESVVIVATDGYRLSYKKQSLAVPLAISDALTLILPARVFSEIAKLAQDKEQDARLLVSTTKNQAIFTFPEITVFTRLIEGNFPKYERIMPQTSTTKAVVDREELLKAVKISSIFAREAANIIRLKIEENQVVLSANTSQIGENTCIVEAAVTGGENEIAFNSRFLLEALTTLNSKEIGFEMTGPLNPGVFKMVDDDSFVHIIMPVRVQG